MPMVTVDWWCIFSGIKRPMGLLMYQPNCSGTPSQVVPLFRESLWKILLSSQFVDYVHMYVGLDSLLRCFV